MNFFLIAQDHEPSSFGSCQFAATDSFDVAHALNHIMWITSDSTEQQQLLEEARQKFEAHKQGYNPSGNKRSRPSGGGSPRSDYFDCETDNWDFEDGTLSGWNVTGNVTTVTGGNDPYGGYPWVFPEGGGVSAKISGDQNGEENGTLSREIHVPPTGVTYFSFHFAMSIFNFPHMANEASKFYVEFYDEDNNLIPCPNFECFYSSDLGAQGIDGFEETPQPASYYNPNADGDSPGAYGVSYTSWNDITLDLSGYAGQTLTVQFRVEWCIYGPDWSYALVEVDCPVNNGQALNVCSEFPQEICGIGSGTGNFQSYEWHDADGDFISDSECITVDAPGSYFCTVLPVDVDCTEGSAITLEYEAIATPIAEFSTSSAAQICVGETIDFTNETEFSEAFISTWDFGDGTVVEADNMSHTFNDYGEYSVALSTEGNGCTNTESMVIEVLPYPEPAFTDETNCATTTISFSDATEMPYGEVTLWQWDFDGDGTIDSEEENPDYDFSTPGDYDVFLLTENAAGCSESTTNTVTVPVPLSASIANLSDYNGYNISCYDQTDGAFAVEPSGGIGDYTISIGNQSVDAGELHDNLGSGIYTVSVTDEDNCTYEIDVELVEPEPLEAEISIVSNYNGADISCFDATDGAASVDITGGVPSMEIDWSNSSSGSASADNLAAGEISVTVTDLNGCETDHSVVLSQPEPITLGAPVTSDYNGYNVRCFGGNDANLSLTADGGTGDLNWLINGQEGDANLANIAAGTYHLEAYDLNGCIHDTIITISQPPQLECDPTILTNYNGYSVSCPESSDGAVQISLNGGIAPYDVLWPDETTTLSHSSLSTSDNYTDITDLNGCTHQCVYTLTAPPPITNEFVIIPDTCQKSSGELTAIPAGGVAPYNVQWTASDNSLILDESFEQKELPEGDYELLVTDANSCTRTFETIMPSVAPANVRIGLTGYPACDERDLNFHFATDRGLQEFTWHFENDVTYDVTDPVHYFEQPGEYTIYFDAIDAFNCEVETAMDLEVLPGLQVFVPNSFTPNEDGINDLFGAKGVGITDYHLIVFNRWGEEIFESFDPADKWNGGMAGGEHYVQPGVYVYRLLVSGNCENRRQIDGTVTVIR